MMQPKALVVLGVLKAEPLRLFSSRELLEACRVRSLNALSVHIHHVRRSLRRARIETVWRKGYRFIPAFAP